MVITRKQPEVNFDESVTIVLESENNSYTCKLAL